MQKQTHQRTFWGKAILNQTPFLIGTALVGISLHLALAWNTTGNFDQVSYQIVANIMQRGGNIYAETSRYNYSPLWAYCLLFCATIADAAHIPLAAVVRTFLTCVDLLNALIIGMISVQLGARRPWPAFTAYLINPVTILIVGYHGQFENLAMLPILLAVWIGLRRPNPPLPAILLLGVLALLIKHNTLFTVWMIFIYLTPTRRQAEILLVAALSLFALSFGPYLNAGANGIFSNVIAYDSQNSLYGLSILLPGYLSRPIFYLVMAALPLLARYQLRMPLTQAVELSVVVLLGLIYGIGEQYFILPVIIGSIRRTGLYWLYTCAATIFLLGSEHNLAIPHVPSLWNTVWLAVVAWGLSFFLTWKPTQLSVTQEIR
ncbi:hypothetical protein EKD04_000865 [Chloroflexales bacterium ZM16-3]|nr:hypothetical protein [Chloroflexales bacterium ZM16-3]